MIVDISVVNTRNISLNTQLTDRQIKPEYDINDLVILKSVLVKQELWKNGQTSSL